MTVEYICNKCGNKKGVKRVIIRADYDPPLSGIHADIIFDEDLCEKCKKRLKVIANKFLNDNEIIW